MARVARQRADTAGVRGFLLDKFRADQREWVTNLGRSHPADEPYPCQRIINDLEAGRTVNVPTIALLRGASAAAPKRVIGDQVVLPARAIVRADETITFTDDGWAALFLEENGLND